MEKILHRGLRYVFDNYESSYEQLLDRADMCSVEIYYAKRQLPVKCINASMAWDRGT